MGDRAGSSPVARSIVAQIFRIEGFEFFVITTRRMEVMLVVDLARVRRERA